MFQKVINPLFRRLLAFFGSFVILSGLIGSYIIGQGVLEVGHFEIYGPLGKALLFAGIAFSLLIRSKKAPILDAWIPRHFVWAGIALASYTLAWAGVLQMATVHSVPVALTIATHVLLIGSVGSILLACFGARELLRLGGYYRGQLVAALASAAGFSALLWAVYQSWEILAGMVLHAVRFLLDLTGIAAAVIPPHTLLLDKFGVTIAQSCSGVESIALFTGLYALVGLLDWNKLNHRRFWLLLPVALVGLFLFNIVRVYLLIIGGYYIDPEIAFSLFHTYAGMVFFIIYAGVFWKLAYGWLLKARS
jgi:exosortase/archaeosortase family protein